MNKHAHITLIFEDLTMILVQNTPKFTILGCFGSFLGTSNIVNGLKLFLIMQCNCNNNMARILRDFIEFLVQNTPELAILGCFGPFLGT